MLGHGCSEMRVCLSDAHASCKGVVGKERIVYHISWWFSVWLLWKKKEKSVVRNVNVNVRIVGT